MINKVKQKDKPISKVVAQIEPQHLSLYYQMLAKSITGMTKEMLNDFKPESTSQSS